MAAHGLRSEAWLATRRLGRPGSWVGERLLRSLPDGHLLVTSETDACIEGYPRSANTVACHALTHLNPTARIAHHLHNPIQVVRAADLEVPCAVTIRRPLDAILSFLVFVQGYDPDRLTPGAAVVRYAEFYRHVLARLDAVAVCRFEAVIEDPSVVGRALNRKFGTRFRADPLDADAKASIASGIERRHRSHSRNVLMYSLPRREKVEMKERFRQEVERDPGLRRANEVYTRLIEAT